MFTVCATSNVSDRQMIYFVALSPTASATVLGVCYGCVATRAQPSRVRAILSPTLSSIAPPTACRGAERCEKLRREVYGGGRSRRGVGLSLKGETVQKCGTLPKGHQHKMMSNADVRWLLEALLVKSQPVHASGSQKITRYSSLAAQAAPPCQSV